jgi:hypothetical protein
MNKEFNRLNNGLLAESLRHAGIFAAIINSRAVEVIAKMIIMESSIYLLYKNELFLASV